MKKKKWGKDIGPVKSMFLGFLFALLSFVLLSLVFSVFIYSSANPTKNLEFISLIILLLSGAVSSLVITRFKAENGSLNAILSCLLFSVFDIFLSLILSGGKVRAVCLLNLICYMSIATLFAFIGKKRNKRKIKY